MTKTCSYCKKTKPAESFYQGRAVCKPCYRLRQRVYYAKGGIRNRKPERRDPRKKRARDKLNYAIKIGRLIRPQACEECKKVGQVEAHHHDYDQPLDVVFLCVCCHASQHTGDRTFTAEEVRAAAAAAAAPAAAARALVQAG